MEGNLWGYTVFRRGFIMLVRNWNLQIYPRGYEEVLSITGRFGYNMLLKSSSLTYILS
jgi:hypothetical protein